MRGGNVEQPGAYLMPQFTGTKDFRSYLRILWRWKYVLLAFLIAAPLAAYLLERGKPNIYQSNALVGVKFGDRQHRSPWQQWQFFDHQRASRSPSL